MYKICFKITNSKEWYCKAIIIVFSVFLALCVVAVPVARTYALSLFSVAAGTLASALAGFGLSAAGAAALWVVVGSIGLGVTVEILVECITNQDANSTFTQNAVKILNGAWDSTKNKLTMTAVGFCSVYNWIRDIFGLDTADTSDFSFSDYCFNIDESNYPNDMDSYVYSLTKTVDSSNYKDIYCIVNPGACLGISLYHSSNFGTLIPSYDDDNNSCSIGDISFSYSRDTWNSNYYCSTVILKPILSNKKESIYWKYAKTVNSFTAGFGDNAFFYKNQYISYNYTNSCLMCGDYKLGFFNKGKEDYSCSSVNELLYQYLIKGNSLCTSSGDFSSSIVTKNYKKYYSSNKDELKSISQSIEELSTKTNASIDSLQGTIAIQAEQSNSTAKADSTSVTAANDVTITKAESTVTDTSTGEVATIPASALWSTGVNEVCNAFGNLSDYFPFCIPGDVVGSIKTLIASEEPPIFDIPFKIDSFNINQTMHIDLTKVNKNNILRGIVKYFILLIFCVGLFFATKKIFF